MEVPAVIPYAIVKSMQAISNVYEMRLLTVILAKAQSGLQTHDTRLQTINVEHFPYNVQVTFPARYILNPGDRNYTNITKAFTLAAKTFAWETRDEVRRVNVIANPTFTTMHGEKMLTVTVDNRLWLEVVDFSKGHRYIDLAVMMRFKSHYSVIMYCLVANQQQSIEYRIETLRRLLGVDGVASYDDFNAFSRRILIKAKEELDKYSPTTFHYSGDRHGRGGRYDLIRIQPVANPNYTLPVYDDAGRVKELEKKKIRLDDRVTDYLATAYEMTDDEIRQVVNYMPKLGSWDAQISILAQIKATAARTGVRNLKGYLHATLKAYRV